MAELELWMRVGQPLEPVLDDTDRILDAWQSGGVRGLVIGRLSFLPDYPEREDGEGSATEDALTTEGPAPSTEVGAVPVAAWGGVHRDAVPAFAPNPTVYRRWNVPVPPDPAQSFPQRLDKLRKLIDNAKRRAWPVYIFEPASGYGPPAPGLPGASGPLITDEGKQRAYLARLEDTLTQFPEADGVILDGPEWGYEIAPGHRSDIFQDLPPEVAPAVEAMGLDYQRLVAAKDRLHQRLHKLSREAATLAAPGGAFTGVSFLGNDPGLVSWMAFRARSLTNFYRQVHQLTEALTRARGRQGKLGVGMRTPALPTK